MTEFEKLDKLELHHWLNLHEGVSVMRVVGGWIYAMDEGICFVPCPKQQPLQVTLTDEERKALQELSRCGYEE